MSMLSLLFSFKGRINRAKFWLGILLLQPLSLLLGSLGVGLIGGVPRDIIGTITLIALYVSFVALSVKRCHDNDSSGWWMLLLAIPVVGWIWSFFECGCTRGTVGPNAYGPDPLAGTASTGRPTRRMTRKQRRLAIIGGSLAVLAFAVALMLNAARDSVVFFFTPAMVAEKHVPAGKRFRLGGLVESGSLVRGDNLAVSFKVSDGNATLPVTYTGILPDLFREGQGVVAEGALDSTGVFKADTVLAKHDENYMPRDVADALKKQGHWKDDYGAKQARQGAPQ